MTRLNKEQDRLIAQMGEAKLAYDAWLATAEREFAVLKDQQKTVIRKLVARGIEAGIPMRQIHQRGLGYKQVGSMTAFLDQNNGVGAAAILGRLTEAPVMELPSEGSALQPVDKSAKPTIRQEPGLAYWIDPATGEEKKVERQDGPVYFYVLNQFAAKKLTEQELAWFADDAKTLIGQEEYDAYFTDGDEPARWAAQPDAKQRRY